MAAPSSVTTTWPATVSQTGEANGVLIALGQPGPAGPDATLKIGVSGTYGTAVLVVRGRLAGMSNFFPIAGVDCKDNTAVGTGGSITLTDNTSYLLKFPVAGFDQVEVYCSSLASGSVVIEKASGPAESVSPPVVNATTTTTSLAAATTVTSTSASALTVGANGATNPVLAVDAATASVATGVKVTGAAAAGGVAIAVISSGTNESSTWNSKGTGTLSIQSSATGNTVVGNTSGGNLVLGNVGTIAAAGSAQGDAQAVVNQVTYVTAADGTKGVVLPAATAGAYYEVYNTHATNGLKVYPASGDDINDGSADAAVTIEGKSLAIFRALDTATWAAIFTANT